MRKQYHGSVAVAVVGMISLVFAGCGGDESDRGSVKFPEDRVKVSYSIPPTTKQVSAEEAASVVAVEGDGERIVLDPNSELAATVAEGEVLMFGITTQTPEGLLRKVISKSTSGEGTVLETRAATLPEAFEELDLEVVHTLRYDEMESFDTALEGLEIRRYPLTLEGHGGKSFQLPFNGTVLYDADGNKNTKDDQVVADGSIIFSVALTLEAKIEWFSLTRLKVGAVVSQDGKLTVKTTWPGLEFEKEVVVGEVPFLPFMVGPVVITPKLEVVLGANGELKAQVVTSLKENVTVNAGAVLENGKWTPYSSVDPKWDFDPPTLTASAEVKAYVGPRLSVKVYTVAGPYAQVVGYLDLLADVNKTPWWELYAGIEGSLGIQGEILGYEFLKWELKGIVDYRKLVAQAESSVPCEPDCTGLECGPDPVCGQSCGTCSKGESCQAGVCVEGPCEPDCTGLKCGPDPVCGQSCGTCSEGESCQAGVCVEGPCEPDCTGLECGPDPVCGQSCGTCDPGESCQDGVCVEGPCEPDCTGLECGPDPVCGVSCGTCGELETCVDGQCISASNGDVWTDPTSGLTWQVTPPGGYMSWGKAKVYCSNLELDGGGWHLPTIGELRTLIRGCPATQIGGTCNIEEGDCLAWSCRDASCKGCDWGGGPGNGGMYWPDEIEGDCCYYWSSSPVEGYELAWDVDFGYGSVSYLDGDVDLHVRCVR